MNSRQTDTVTRVDLRIPNHLYSQIQSIATSHFNAKIHHRSNKPEVTPTILKLIQIGIAHIESNLPVADEVNERKVAEADDLKRQIKELDARLSKVESKLQGVESNNVEIEVVSQVSSDRGRRSSASPALQRRGTDDEELSDSELSKLLNLSSALIYRYRRDGKANRAVIERLKDWDIRGDRWVKK